MGLRVLSIAVLGMIATLCSAVQAAEPAPKVYKPASAWAADYGDDYCRLIREYSDGKDKVSLTFERVQPTSSARLILMGDRIETYRGAEQLGYAFSPVEGERKAPYVHATTADGHQLFIIGDAMLMPLVGAAAPGRAPTTPYDRAAELAFAAGVNAVTFGSGLTEPLRIETGELRSPIEALQKCADDLLTFWGLDAAKHQTMTRPVQAATDASKWLPSNTLGFEDFPRLSGGANQVRVMVSADGQPTGCFVHAPSLEPKTNDALCKAIMERARFLPALDKDGQAMASYWTVSPFVFLPPFPGR